MEELIKNLGLEESEAKVYLALLELGPSSVTEITRKAKITRTLGYHVLEKLGWYGLVEEVSGRGAKKNFAAQHPRQLKQFIENKKQTWEKNLKEIDTHLPNLISLYKMAEKPVVRYQQGLDGVKQVYWETLDSKTEILSILDIEGWDTAELRTWGKDYNQERSRRKIHERILILDTKQAREWMKYYRGSLKYTNYRWIKPEQLPGIKEFGGEINVYENKVVMVLLKKPNQMGVLMESAALSNILKSLFELAWTVGVSVKGRKTAGRLKIKN